MPVQLREQTWILLLSLIIQSVITSGSGSPNVDPTTITEAAFKEYFDITEGRTLLGMIFLAAMMVMCTLGGIGGNLVILPVCLIFFRFDPHVAVAHTSLFASISSIVRVFIETVLQPHEKRINYDVVLISCTPTILGTLLGVFMNQASPNVLIMVLTFLLLSYLMMKSFKEYAVRKHHEERTKKDSLIEMEQRVIDTGEDVSVEIEMIPLPAEPANNLETSKKVEKQNDVIFSTNFENEKVDAHDQYKLYTNDIYYYALLLLINPLFSLLRGSKERGSWLGITKCSFGDFILILSYLGFLVYLTIHLKNMATERNKRVLPNPMNVSLEGSEPMKVMTIMILVGFVGSFLSAGASALITFSLIMLKMAPFIASPTSLLIGIIFNSSAAFVYYLEGSIYNYSAVVGGLIVAIATAAVRLTIYESFIKLKKASLVLLFMSIMMGMGALVSVIVVGPKVVDQYRSGVNIWALRSICN